MSRSVKKGPYVQERLYNRVEQMNAANEKKVVKTLSLIHISSIFATACRVTMALSAFTMS